MCLLLHILSASHPLLLGVVGNPFSLSYDIPFCVYTAIYLSMLWLMGIWEASVWGHNE